MVTRKFYLKLLMSLLLMAFVVPHAQAVELTVANGTETSDHIPIYGYYWDTGFKNTMVYPASMLSDMDGGTINSITFYANSETYTALQNGTLKVSLGEVEGTTVSGHLSGLTQVFSGTPVKNGDKCVITFTAPYEYSGGNLAVECHLTSTGSNYPTINFVGIEKTSASYHSYGSSLSNGNRTENFLPKATFDYDAASLADYAASVTPNAADGLNFGALAVGASKTINVTLRNKGANAFTPTVNVSGTGFSTTYTAAEIASKGSATIPVVFTPTNAGNYTGTLSINCGQAGSFTFDLTGSAANELVICDATTTTGYLPVYGTQYDNAQINQMLYPAEKLSGLSGKTLKSMTFYPVSGISFKKVPASFSLANMPAGTTAYTSSNPTRLQPAGLTAVGSIQVAETAQADITEWTLVFDTPFTYDGGDLLIEVTTPTGGGWGSTNFYAESLGSGNYQSYYSYGSSSTGVYYLPKVKFTFEDTNPTIIADPASISGLTAEVGGTPATTTVAVTGVNLTNDIIAAIVETDSPFSIDVTSIAQTDGAASGNITITYTASAVGEQIGTLRLTSDGATTVDVPLNATGTAPAGPTITTSVTELAMNANVGAPVTKTFTVTGANLTGNITVAATGDGFSVSPTTITEADAANGVTVTVTYNPVAAGTHNGTVTLTSDGAQTVTVALTGTAVVVPNYAVAVTGDEGTHVHNFGEVVVGAISNWTITVTNTGSEAVTPTLTGVVTPYSTNYVATSLAANASATITFTFEPTEFKEYDPVTVILSFPEANGTIDDYSYTLRGKGIEDTDGTMPPSFYDGIEYTWTPDGSTDVKTSKLSDIATDPDQMIALMKEVYTNKTIPGNWYRGYKADGTTLDREVAYPAIGTISRDFADGAYTHNFNDAYGWGMNHDETAYPMVTVQYVTQGSNPYTYDYFKMNPNEFKPEEEGVTLLLVEVNDGVDYNTVSSTPSDYASLRNIVSTMFKSVRVVTHSKHYTNEENSGTLFKIDCDKMNRFFFLAKGRLRLYNDEDDRIQSSAYYRDATRNGSTSGQYYNSEMGPFYEMFEQFSPVTLTTSGTEATDIYQELVNMQSYAVEHDCESVAWSTGNSIYGHEFNMYGKTSISEDCQDVRDLMFFVPDKRMQWWYEGTNASRDGRNIEIPTTDMFKNYNKQYTPTMGLYVIRQNEITGEQANHNGSDKWYQLHLSWVSNLTDFLPGAEGTYYIYQVMDDGTYQLVGTTTSDVTTLDVWVQMQQHGQQVTYVIQGQDNSRFLSLQMSNEESFIIPGLDKNEKFQMMPSAEYYSRFDPQTVHNFYANGMQVMAYPDAATSDYAGQTFNFYRKAAGDTDWTLVGTAQVNTAGTEATVSMVEGTQRQQSEYKFGYKQNPATVAVTTDANSNKVFGVIFDNFKANVSTNQHPSSYSYKMEVANTLLHSNEISIKVYKTQMRNLTGTFTEEYVENDEVRQDVDNSRQFDIDVEHSSKTEILRYGAYRWNSSYGTSSNPFAILNLNSTEEEDISPQGQASNQGEFYSVYMNGDSYIGDDVYVAQGETGQATFVDDVPATTNKADEYTYAPVIETFTGRADYNTYGAPMQTTATGKIAVTPVYGEKSEYTWEANGNTYRYYNVFVNVNTLDLPEGYEVAKVRAWRKIDASYLNEKLEAYAYRAKLDANGEFMFDDPETANTGTQLGNVELPVSTNQNRIYKGTFGALDVENGATVPMKFFVRVYFKKSGSKAANEYYITEYEVDGELNDKIPTSIFGVQTYKVVTGVKYYNLAGIESDVPFQGVNIEVTTYEDGSRTTRKIMK